MRIYARQIPPEYQESPLYWSRNPRTRELDLADTWPGVSLTGNRHFCGYTAEEYDDAERATNEAAEEYNNGKEWTGERVTLRGCCQGDYIECTYPRNKYSAADLERLEKEYFNTGEEWTIYDGDPNENPEADSFSMYVYSWDDDEKRKEIAAAAGVDPAEIEMHAFTGWSRSACYA